MSRKQKEIKVCDICGWASSRIVLEICPICDREACYTCSHNIHDITDQLVCNECAKLPKIATIIDASYKDWLALIDASYKDWLALKVRTTANLVKVRQG